MSNGDVTPISQSGNFCGNLHATYMVRNEGVRRIMMTGKVIMLIGVTLGVALGLMTYLVWGITTALYVLALGGLVWAAGWIVQGFIQADP